MRRCWESGWRRFRDGGSKVEETLPRGAARYRIAVPGQPSSARLPATRSPSVFTTTSTCFKDSSCFCHFPPYIETQRCLLSLIHNIHKATCRPCRQDDPSTALRKPPCRVFSPLADNANRTTTPCQMPKSNTRSRQYPPEHTLVIPRQSNPLRAGRGQLLKHHPILTPLSNAHHLAVFGQVSRDGRVMSLPSR